MYRDFAANVFEKKCASVLRYYTHSTHTHTQSTSANQRFLSFPSVSNRFQAFPIAPHHAGYQHTCCLAARLSDCAGHSPCSKYGMSFALLALITSDCAGHSLQIVRDIATACSCSPMENPCCSCKPTGWRAAAYSCIHMENPCCSCKPTHLPIHRPSAHLTRCGAVQVVAAGEGGP